MRHLADDEEDYCGTERRTFSSLEAAFDRRLKEHEERERQWSIEQLESIRVGFMRAFPDGAEKHHEYHQRKIDAAKDEAEFWKAAKLEVTKVGVSTVLSVIRVVAILALISVAYKFGFGPLVTKLIG